MFSNDFTRHKELFRTNMGAELPDCCVYNKNQSNPCLEALTLSMRNRTSLTTVPLPFGHCSTTPQTVDVMEARYDIRRNKPLKEQLAVYSPPI